MGAGWGSGYNSVIGSHSDGTWFDPQQHVFDHH